MYLRTSCLLLAGLALLSAVAIANSYPQPYERDAGSCARRRHRHQHHDEREQYGQDSSNREHYDRDHEDEHKHRNRDHDGPYAELKKSSTGAEAKVGHNAQTSQQYLLALRWCCRQATCLTLALSRANNSCRTDRVKSKQQWLSLYSGKAICTGVQHIDVACLCSIAITCPWPSSLINLGCCPVLNS